MGSVWAWPWEFDDYYQKQPKFLKDEIIERYLVNVFDPDDVRFVQGYGKGYDFVLHDDEWGSYEPKYAIRVSRLTDGNRYWTAKLEPTAAEYILFFGFRSVNKRWGDLEFCLRLPMKEDFKDRNKITIPDDTIVLQGYARYSVDSQTLEKMKDVINAINNHDSKRLEEYLPERIRERYTFEHN